MFLTLHYNVGMFLTLHTYNYYILLSSPFNFVGTPISEVEMHIYCSDDFQLLINQVNIMWSWTLDEQTHLLVRFIVIYNAYMHEYCILCLCGTWHASSIIIETYLVQYLLVQVHIMVASKKVAVETENFHVQNWPPFGPKRIINIKKARLF